MLRLPRTQDFALEADEGQMRAGAHLIAGSLSGSLALATGKEPLRSALSTQLRQMLHGRLSPPELEATITVSFVHLALTHCVQILRTSIPAGTHNVCCQAFGRAAVQCHCSCAGRFLSPTELSTGWLCAVPCNAGMMGWCSPAACADHRGGQPGPGLWGDREDCHGQGCARDR